MFKRTLTALTALTLLSSGNLFGQQPRQQPTGVIVLKMSGELAQQYAQVSGAIEGVESPRARNIRTSAVVVQSLENGEVRIEHSALVKREGKPDRLVTLTATVDSKMIRLFDRTVFDKTTVFTFSGPSPGAKEAGKTPVLSPGHSARELSLANLQRVKLRSWRLESETGE